MVLGTRALLLHAALRARLKDAPSGSGGEAAAAAAELDDASAGLLVELLQVVQALKQLPAPDLVLPALAALEDSNSAPPSDDKQAKGKDKKEKDKDGKKSSASPPAAATTTLLVRAPAKPRHSAAALVALLAALQSLGPSFEPLAHRLAYEVAHAHLGLAPQTTSSATTSSTTSSSAGKRAKSKPPGGGDASSSNATAAGPAAASSSPGELVRALLGAASSLRSKAVKEVGLPAGLCAVRFQLGRHMAHLLERPHQAVEDARVYGFRPDPWQQRLLDVVDQGEASGQGAAKRLSLADA